MGAGAGRKRLGERSGRGGGSVGVRLTKCVAADHFVRRVGSEGGGWTTALRVTKLVPGAAFVALWRVCARRAEAPRRGAAGRPLPRAQLGSGQLGRELRRALAEALDVAQLDVLVAADEVGQLGDLGDASRGCRAAASPRRPPPARGTRRSARARRGARAAGRRRPAASRAGDGRRAAAGTRGETSARA